MKLKIHLLVLSVIILLSENLNAQMTWNQACSFAGTVSSHIAVPHSASLDITGSFTIEAWINPVNSESPATQIILQKRLNGNKGYTFLLSGGKAGIRTGSVIRLTGATTIPNNEWTHVAAVYDAVTGGFTIYVNGAADGSAIVALAAPPNNGDSLLIGIGENSPFAGKMDEIRIWNKPNVSDINNYKYMSFGTNTGAYSGLVLSLTFQNSNPSGTLFSLTDWSGSNNNGLNRGVTAVDFSNRPENKISINECAKLDGSGDYMAAGDHPVLSPTLAITMEAWLNPRSFNSNPDILCPVIHKGNAGGTTSDYDISISSNKLVFSINDQPVLTSSVSSGNIIPLNQWTHIAFTYNGLSGYYQYIKNGIIQTDDILLAGNIHDSNDSLYIGGTPSLQCFDGYIDEIRITSTDLLYGDIGGHIFTSVNESNDPAGANAVYNLDGGLTSNTDVSSKLNFRGGAGFSINSGIDNTPVSPMTLSASTNFQNGFYINNPMTRIPNSGTSGFMISDTIDIKSSDVISDVNVFVALNHTDEDNLIISLVSPSGTAVTLYSTSSLSGSSDNVITMFDDQADSSLGSNRYVMYSPVIKPLTGLNSALSGLNTSGKWKLRIQDIAAGDTGTLNGWGIQFNNQTTRNKKFTMTSLIQGFYRSASNLMIPDTIRVYLRNAFSPFALLDSSKAYTDSTGTSLYRFNNLSINDGVPFLIQVKHRNSVETWSSFSEASPIHSDNSFSPLNSSAAYDFSTAQSKAFGSNQIQVDNSPVNKFALYGGDVNQEGNIDLTDVLTVYNDASNFTNGYVNTDVTGEKLTDLTDVIITYNNAGSFVSAIRP